ncbi:MAG: purine-binding chemotaxis protein CheW [Calditrichaeota bacterium]|nr:purine-binding chemotaxis protein CheW [Calditrichota bacterium]
METETRVSLVNLLDQLFAIEIKYIREVLPLPRVTRLPNVEPQFVGVFNLRGKIISLIDICPILGLGAQKLLPDYFVVACEVNGKSAGLLAEKVMEMRSLETDQMQIPGSDLQPDLLPYVSAMYEDGKYGSVYVLDLPALFESNALNKYRFE